MEEEANEGQGGVKQNEGGSKVVSVAPRKMEDKANGGQVGLNELAKKKYVYTTTSCNNVLCEGGEK